MYDLKRYGWEIFLLLVLIAAAVALVAAGVARVWYSAHHPTREEQGEVIYSQIQTGMRATEVHALMIAAHWEELHTLWPPVRTIREEGQAGDTSLQWWPEYDVDPIIQVHFDQKGERVCGKSFLQFRR